jgi:hypothetical protein
MFDVSTGGLWLGSYDGWIVPGATALCKAAPESFFVCWLTLHPSLRNSQPVTLLPTTGCRRGRKCESYNDSNQRYRHPWGPASQYRVDRQDFYRPRATATPDKPTSAISRAITTRLPAHALWAGVAHLATREHRAPNKVIQTHRLIYLRRYTAAGRSYVYWVVRYPPAISAKLVRAL